MRSATGVRASSSSAPAALLFVVGLVDDIVHLKPYQKLIGQIVGAALVDRRRPGPALDRAPPLVNMAITMFWLIGITNAVNMLDNMDGLAAGVAAIAALFLAPELRQPTARSTEAAVMLVGFAAALIGFLLYNSQPGVDLHGRLRVDVHRLLPGQHGAAHEHGRPVAQLRRRSSPCRC